MISVSGIPGSGKSTLATALSDMLSWPVIRFDDYEALTAMHPSAVVDWLDHGAPLSDSLAPGFRQAATLAGPEAILDTPFGPLWPGLGEAISVSVWIDCPFDIALARKLGTLAQAGTSDPGFAGWLEQWLSAYHLSTRRACLDISERARPLAHCIVDGTRPSSDNFGDVCAHLRARHVF